MPSAYDDVIQCSFFGSHHGQIWRKARLLVVAAAFAKTVGTNEKSPLGDMSSIGEKEGVLTVHFNEPPSLEHCRELLGLWAYYGGEGVTFECGAITAESVWPNEDHRITKWIESATAMVAENKRQYGQEG